MKSSSALVALGVCAVLSGATVAAQQPAAAPPAPVAPSSSAHDSNAPLDWIADRIEVQDREHKATLAGNVRVVQQEMTMTSDRATALYTGSLGGQQDGGDPKIQRLDANGHVVVTRPGEVAKGNYGIYDLQTKLITLIGNVSLDRNGSVVHGGRLVIDQNTNRATVDGSAVANGTTGKGGRVSGRFLVDQNKSSTPPAAAKPAPATVPKQ